MRSSRQRAARRFSELKINTRNEYRKAILAAAVGAAALSALAPSVQAVQYIYTPAGSTDQWSLGANWSGTPLSAADTQLTFVGDNTTVLSAGQVSVSNNDNGGNFQLNILDLQGTGDATASSATSISITGNTLELINSGADPVINLNALAGTAGINYAVGNNLVLTNNATFTGNGNANFTFAGNFSGAGGLEKSGSSTLYLSGVNTYAGNTVVSGGTLRVGTTSALSGYATAGSISVSNGTLAVVAGGAGQWTSGDIATLLASGNFGVGARLGLHVDQGNSLAYSTNFSGTTGLAKSGSGSLTLSGNNTHSGTTTLGGGRLNVNSATALGTGTFAINSNTVLDNTSGGAITNANNNPVSWNGSFIYAGSNALNLGSGVVSAGAARTVTVRGSTLTMGPISSGFGITKLGAGTLVIDNSTNSYTDTLVNGGVLDLGTTGVLGTGSVLLQGGEIRAAGTSGGARNITAGTLTPNGYSAQNGGAGNGGRSVITLVADPAQPITLTASDLGARFYGSTTLYRGTNLGTAPAGTAGAANIVFTNAPAVGNDGITSSLAASGTGTLYTDEAAVLRGALIDTSATGNGTGFATYEVNGVNGGTTTYGVRALRPSEQTSTYAANKNVRLNLTGAASFTGVTTNTLQLHNASGSPQTVTNSGSSLLPAHGLLFSGSNPITLTGGTIPIPAARDVVIQSTNTAGVTIATTLGSTSGQRGYTFGGPGEITVTGTVSTGSNGGVAVNGPGTVNFSGTTFSLSTFGLNVAGGTARLNPSLNLGTSSGLSGTRAFRVAAGATLDLNGFSIDPVPTSTSNAIDTFGDLNGGGGTITNTNGTTSTVTVYTGSSGTGSGSQDFSGTITGNINLVRNLRNTSTSTYVQVLSGANTYTGYTRINAGALQIGNHNSLPATTPLIINGSHNSIASTLNLAGFNQTVASLEGVTGGGGGGGFVENNTPATTSVLTVGGSTSTSYANVIRDNNGQGGGAVALTRAGTGVLTLSGQNTYSGGTNIDGGVLRTANTAGSATGSGPVNINSGGKLDGTGIVTGPISVNNGGTLGGSGTLGGAVTVNAGGHLAPGASVGTLTLNNALTLSASSILDFEFSGGSNDVIEIDSASDLLTLNGGGFNLLVENSVNAFDTPGTYTLMEYAGNILGTGTTALSVLNPQFGRDYDFAATGSALTLTITSTLVTSTWTDGNANSLWTDGGNWSSTIPNSQGATAVFDNTGGGGAVLLNGNKTVGGLTFDSASAYDISGLMGGTLFLDNSTSSAAITNLTGSHTISAPVSLTSNTTVTVGQSSDTLAISGNIAGAGVLTKSGSGTLVLGGANSHASTIVDGGAVQIGADNALGSGATLINAGTLATTSGFTTSRNFQVGNAASAIDVVGGQTLRLDGSITDGPSAGALNKAGLGTLVINGTASNTGGTAVSSGVLQIGVPAGATGAIGSGPVTVNGGASILVQRTGTTTIAGGISGAGSISQPVVGGTLALTGNNFGFTGLVDVNSASLSMGHSSGIGGATLNLTNGTLTQTTNATIYNGGTASASFSKIVLAGANVIDPNGSSMTLSAELVGDATTSITRSTGGTLSLGLAGNTNFTNGAFAGTFTNSAGNLHFASRNSGSAAGKFIFNGGTVTIGNAGGTVNMGYLEGSAPISGTSGTIRLRVGDASTATTSFSSAYSGNIVGTTVSFAKFGAGTQTLSGQNQFSGVDGVTFPTPSTFQGFTVVVGAGTLIAGSSTNGITSGPFGGVDPGANENTDQRRILLGNTGNLSDANLMIGGPHTVANRIRVSGGGATLNTGYTLRLGGTTDNTAIFSGSITLQSDLTVTQVATTGNNALVLSGIINGSAANRGADSDYLTFPGANNDGLQTLTFAGPGRINATGDIIDGDFDSGIGVLSVATTGGIATLTGANTYTGTTTVAGGTLVLGPNAHNPVLGGHANAGAILNGGKLVMDYTGGSSPKAALVDHGTEGIKANAADHATGRLRTTLSTPDATKAIGWLDDGTSTFQARYTHKGDINLDGLVDSLDFSAFVSGYGMTSGAEWANGDFDLAPLDPEAGKVNTHDFNYLAGNFGAAPVSGTLPSAALGAVVPEPTSLGLVAVGLLALASRRRRA